MTDDITLGSLTGKHALTGCDMSGVGDANAILFVLDGVTYRAEEDECDGYRSSLGTLEIVTTPVRNTFAPVEVVGRMQDEVLTFIDAVTGRDVLSVGTDNSDSYYPCYVASFTPENMAINQHVGPSTEPRA